MQGEIRGVDGTVGSNPGYGFGVIHEEVSRADWTSTGGPSAALPDGYISDRNGPDNPFGFGGYVFNPESLQYIVRHRDYYPANGRFLQRDPSGYVDGMNLYEYVRGGPIVATDPMGNVAPKGWRGFVDDDSPVSPI